MSYVAVKPSCMSLNSTYMCGCEAIIHGTEIKEHIIQQDSHMNQRRNVFTLFVKDIWFSEFGTVSAIWQLDDPYKKNASLKMICIY